MTDASKTIQIDRYSLKSEKGASVAFLDTTRRFEGWKTIFDTAQAWVQYNSVDFGKHKLSSVHAKALSKTGGTLEIRRDKVDGPVLARVELGKTGDWSIVSAPVSASTTGIHNVVVLLRNNGKVELDWISFE